MPAREPEPSLAEAFCSSVLQPELWSCLEERRPAHVPGAAVQLPGLLSPDDVVAAFIHGGESGATSSFKRGEPYMRENIFMAYLDKATLSLMDAERHLRPLLELCRALVPSFDYVTARLVLEPPDSRGPAIRTDSDMLMLQLWGEQRLMVRRPLAGLPVSAPRPKPLLEPQLQPGDVLLLPQGVECQVMGSTSAGFGGGGGASASSAPAWGPTLYAVLTLRTNEQSFEASLGRYLNDLLREASFSPEADRFLRSAASKRDFPQRYPDALEGRNTSDADGELKKQLLRSAEELASKVDSAGFRKHFDARMRQLCDEQGKGAEQLLAGSSTSGPLPPPGVIQSDSRIAVCKGICCRCQPGSDVAHFKRGGETLNLPIARSASDLIHRLSDGEPHAVGSLPCDDPVERLCVCQILIMKGCLEAVSGPGA